MPEKRIEITILVALKNPHPADRGVGYHDLPWGERNLYS
jgi:hypothetical protein